jgi:hypothetical protein
MFANFERLARSNESGALSLLSECKALARKIKVSREPSTTTETSTSFPSKDVADQMVNAYFRTFESTFRVLHIPSFWKDYEAFWASSEDMTQTPVTPFQLQVKLVMSIGAVLYDRDFSYRKNAIEWVREATVWLSVPRSKSRLTVSGLQVMILLCIARETTGLGADLIWISVGSLLRTAISMGLHRDPKVLPKASLFQEEMHRRLWNTILEVRQTLSIKCLRSYHVTTSERD